MNSSSRVDVQADEDGGRAKVPGPTAKEEAMRKLLVAATIGAFVLAAAPNSADAKGNRGRKVGSVFKRVKAKFKRFVKRAKDRFRNYRPKTALGRKFKAGIGKFAKKVHGKLQQFRKKARKFFGKVKGKVSRAIRKGAGFLNRLGKKALRWVAKRKPHSKLGKKIKAGLLKVGHKVLRRVDKRKRYLLKKLKKLPGPKPVPAK